MNRDYTLAPDKGICEFCGQLVENFEQEVFVNINGDSTSRISHEGYWEDILEQRAKEGNNKKINKCL